MSRSAASCRTTLRCYFSPSSLYIPDVSSGLKWALYSNSVVLMPRPTFTSWAMEERLEPWVHYVPLRDDLSDVEDRVRWVIDHPDQARAIAHAGTLWISDLVYHPHADDDDDCAGNVPSVQATLSTRTRPGDLWQSGVPLVDFHGPISPVISLDGSIESTPCTS
jgi:hypothetical protein